MIPLKAILTTAHGSFPTQVEEEDFLVMHVNGVKIELDGFEVLSIEMPPAYTADQLSIFDYDIRKNTYEGRKWDTLFLKDFQLDAFIPLSLVDRETQIREIADLHIRILADKNRKYQYLFELLSATSEQAFIDDALGEIWKKLRDRYHIEICACCKNSCTNPYGGIAFTSQLCFKAIKEQFWGLDKVDKASISSLTHQNLHDIKNVTDHCEEFLPNITSP